MKLFTPLYRRDFKDTYFILYNRPLYKSLEDLRNCKCDYYTVIDYNDTSLKPIDNYLMLTYKKKVQLKNISVELIDEDIVYKHIPNYNRYLALDTGEILNLKTGNRTKGVSAGHYLKVNLIKDDELIGKMLYVHRIMASTYHGHEDGKVVMHKDENKFNNKPSNLKYGTQSENVKDSHRHRGNITTEDNDYIDNNTKGINHMKTIHLTNELPFTDSLDLQKIAETVSFEDNMFTTSYNFIADKLSDIPKMFTRINKTLDDTGYNIKIEQVKDLKKFIKSAEKLSNKVDYAKIEYRKTPVIVGLNVKFIRLSKFLNEYSGVMTQDLLPMLKETNKKLANTISDPTYGKSFKDTTKLYKKQADKLDEVKEEMYKVINPNMVIDRLPVNKVLNSVNETKLIGIELLEAANGFDSKKLAEAKKLSLLISEKVNVIIDMMKKKELELSKPSLHGLINNIEMSANLLTVNTQLYYLFVQEINMLMRLEETLLAK